MLQGPLMGHDLEVKIRGEAVCLVFVEAVCHTRTPRGQPRPLAGKKGQWSISVKSAFFLSPFSHTVESYCPLPQYQSSTSQSWTKSVIIHLLLGKFN